MNKRCPICEKELDLSLFKFNKGGKYGCRGACILCEKERKSSYYKLNKKVILQNKKIYASDNQAAIQKRTLLYEIGRMRVDPLFRLKKSVSSLIRNSLKANNGSKGGKQTKTLLGCSIPDLKNHLESQFQLDMSWNNYGNWHIDHICPVSQARTSEELLKLQHFSNLRPLWKQDNLNKSDSATIEAIINCFKLLNRDWIED